MSSGMNMQEAEKVAENMSYRQAVINCLYARCVPYRKATKIKMKQLLEELKDLRKWKEQEEKACDRFYQQGRADERKKILDILKTFIESDYNSKECKLLVSDLQEFMWEGEQKE